jgi:PAS domain S-box-containing protein
MKENLPSYEELQKRIAMLELRLRQIESRDYIVKENDAEIEALRVNYEVVFRNTNFYVAFYKPNGEIVAYNKIAADEVGFSSDDLVGKTVWDVFEKSQADLFYSRMKKAMEQRSIVKFEELNKTKYGISWYETDYIPVFDENEELIGCQVLARDIGEKKNAIDELAVSRELFKSIFEQSNAGIAISNSEGEFVDVNEQFALMLGYTRTEILNLNIKDITYHQEFDLESEFIQKILANEIDEYVIEKRYVRKNGEIFWVNLSSNVVRNSDGEILYSVGIIIDIQKLKDTQKELDKSNERYKILIDNQIEGVTINDRNEEFVFANRAAEEILGVNEGELVGQNIKSFLSEESLKLVQIESNKRSLGETSSYEVDITTNKGEIRNIFVHAVPNIGPNGEYNGTLAFFRDITTQRSTEKQLEESHYRYQTVLENTSEGVFVVKNELVVFANKAVREFTGYLSKIDTDLYYLDLIHPDDYEVVASNYTRRMKGEIIPAYDVRIKTNKGDYRWFVINAVKIDWQGEPADLVFTQDIHERKVAEFKLQEKTKELEKLNNTKDRLLSIIGHDLRNPLNNINGFVFLLEKSLGSKYDSKSQKYINAIYQSSSTLNELLENLLAWSKTQTQKLSLNLEKAKLYDLIEQNISAFIHNANFKSIQLQNDVDKSITLMADKAMLSTMIRNLISNSIKFTPKDGKVRIYAQSDEENCTLCVEDSGIGLSQNDLDNILQGGYDLSKDGTQGEKGTGLGLQIVNDLISLHNGEFGIKKSKNEGTVFCLSFPSI